VSNRYRAHGIVASASIYEYRYPRGH
jgi:hypothetical protein